jgi:tetratricopeptide (TPR) repeat protein
MHRNLVVCTFLAVALICASGCSHTVELHRAQRLEQQGRPSQALEIYKAQYDTTPGYQHGRRAELQYRIGECLLAMGRAREAFSAYSRAVDIDETFRPAHLRLGQMYLLSGSSENAGEQAEAALKSGGINLDALALYGEAAAANGDNQVARSAFQAVLEKDPSRIKVALSLADVLNREGDPNAAKEVLMKIAKAQPGSGTPWLAIGRIEESLGNIKAAEDAYRTAVHVEDTPETNLRLAQYLERTARVQEAKTILLHVDALCPKFPTANADFAFISDRTDQARQGYLTALNRLVTPAETSSEERARTIARLIEADLSVGDSSQRNVPPTTVAQAHLDYFRRELDPATVHILEAEIAFTSGDLATAGVHADAAVQLAPDSAAADYIAGIVKLRSGDFIAARKLLEDALENDDDHIPTRLALTQIALSENDVHDALGYIVPVVRKEPGNYRALILFGRVLIAQKEYPSAEIIAARAEVVAPDAGGPDLLRGEIALALNDPGKALIDFQKAMLRDPHSQEAVDGLARAYRSGHVKHEMLLDMEHIGLQDPPSATLLEITGRLFAERGWTEDAKRAFFEALRTDPGSSSAALQLARLLARTGQETKATQYALLVPGLRHVVEGVVAENDGREQDAIDHYEAAFRAGDRTAVAANNLAWLYAVKGIHLDRALSAAQQAVQIQPDDAAVMDTLGFVYLRRREYTNAVKTLQHARSMAQLSRSPELASIEKHLRTAYLRAGQPELAAQLHPTH